MTTSPARISAADANRQFSKLLGRVRAGETVVITSHGTPVATFAPATDEDKAEAEWKAAHDELFHRLRTQKGLPLVTWTRDELYER